MCILVHEVKLWKKKIAQLLINLINFIKKKDKIL